MSSSTSSFPWSRPAARRRNDSTTTAAATTTPSSGDLLRPAVDPAPNPRPIFQWVGFGFIIFLCFLQFLLPATHFRHPSDPLREWLPFPSNLSSPSSSGGVEELLGVDLKNFAIAVAEDCSKRLSAYVNFHVLEAIQRSASNPWVSGTPYSEEACMPDLSLVFIDGSRLEKNLLEAILWWSKVLNKSERDSPNPAVALALYNRHLKPDINYKRLIHRYDGGRNIYSESCGGAIRPDVRNLWKQYLPPMSDQILGY